MAETVSAVCNLLGVTNRALRHYEDVGLISPGREGLARRYTGADIERLREILRLKKCGASLEEIRVLLCQRETDDAVGTRAAEIELAQRLLDRAQAEYFAAMDRADVVRAWMSTQGGEA